MDADALARPPITPAVPEKRALAANSGCRIPPDGSCRWKAREIRLSRGLVFRSSVPTGPIKPAASRERIGSIPNGTLAGAGGETSELARSRGCGRLPLRLVDRDVGEPGLGRGVVCGQRAGRLLEHQDPALRKPRRQGHLGVSEHGRGGRRDPNYGQKLAHQTSRDLRTGIPTLGRTDRVGDDRGHGEQRPGLLRQPSPSVTPASGRVCLRRSREATAGSRSPSRVRVRGGNPASSS